MTDEERTIIENYIADELLPDDISGMNGYNQPYDIADGVINAIEEARSLPQADMTTISQIIWDHQNEFIAMVREAFFDGSEKGLLDKKELLAKTRAGFDKWLKGYLPQITEKILEAAASGIYYVTIVRRCAVDHNTDTLLKSKKFPEALRHAYPSLTVVEKTDTGIFKLEIVEIRWDDETV